MYKVVSARKKTSQELRMLSRSLSGRKVLLLNDTKWQRSPIQEEKIQSRRATNTCGKEIQRNKVSSLMNTGRKRKADTHYVKVTSFDS